MGFDGEFDGLDERRINVLTDHCSKDGAERLRQRIEDYWKERGFEIQGECRQEPFTHAMRGCRWDVRSDMVGGYPKKSTASK